MDMYFLLSREANRADCPFNPDRHDGANFDSALHPILARHYGIEPSRPIGQIAAEVIAELPAEVLIAEGLGRVWAGRWEGGC